MNVVPMIRDPIVTRTIRLGELAAEGYSAALFGLGQQELSDLLDPRNEKALVAAIEADPDQKGKAW
jgi:hypothetical protein